MPVSTRRYSELRLAISDYLQQGNWQRLLEVCGTSDDEVSRTIAVIFTLYDPRNVWKFLDYVSELSTEERRQKRDSIATCCYTLGKMGQSDIKKTIILLKRFLLEDRFLKDPVIAALSNMWVLDRKNTSSILYDSWILGNDQSEDLQEASLRSVEYLTKESPNLSIDFLEKVDSLGDERKMASGIAQELISKYASPKRTPSEVDQQIMSSSLKQKKNQTSRKQEENKHKKKDKKKKKKGKRD